MSDLRTVFVITLVDRHFDPVISVHESEEGAELRVAEIKRDYAYSMSGTEWRRSIVVRLPQLRAFIPAIRVERKEVNP